MGVVTLKEHEQANKRFRRRQRENALKHAISKSVGTFNIIGSVGFEVEHIYQVGWMVDGQLVGQTILTIPSEECKEQTAAEWFKQYVETMMFAFDIAHADIIVSEVIDDTKTMHQVRNDEAH